MSRGPQAKRYRNPERSNDLDDAVAARDASPGPLNPSWVEWLMGFPQDWTAGITGSKKKGYHVLDTTCPADVNDSQPSETP